MLTADSPSLLTLFGTPQWGIFTSTGAPILAVDSVFSVEYARDYQISDYPQEKGAFESYNKVQVPYQAKVSFLIGPSRRAFLSTVEAAVQNLELVTIVTPEFSYSSANLMHYSYRREARAGVSMIRVDVWAEEVRIIAAVGNPPTQSTNGASATSSGTVQAVPSGETFAGTDTSAPVTPTGTPAGGNVTVTGVTGLSFDNLPVQPLAPPT